LIEEIKEMGPSLKTLILHFLLGTFCALGLNSTALANDGAAGFVGGELVFKNVAGIEMRSEDLILSPAKVTVSYEFYNKTEKAITTIIAFPISYPLESDLNFDPNSKNPSNFMVRVNGSEVTFQNKVEKEEHREIVKHYWKQQFAAKSITKIEHEYKPVYEKGVYEDILEEILTSKKINKDSNEFLDQYYSYRKKNYCISDAMIKKLRSSRTYFMTLPYILKTAATWDGPIGTFRLRLEKGGLPFLFLCTDLKLRKTSANAFEVVVKNYVPKKDLSIAFAKNANVK
jgi:hypothetical protein